MSKVRVEKIIDELFGDKRDPEGGYWIDVKRHEFGPPRTVNTLTAEQLTTLLARHLSAPQPAEQWQAAIDVVYEVQNANDLNDGGFFEAGFIAAKTKILDALMEKRDAPDATVVKGRDGWVTFGRIKIDLETETETFERIPLSQGEGDAQPRNILKFERPKQSCCEALLSAENAEYIGFTERGMVLLRDEDILADISFCPFCGARIMPKGSYV